MVTLLLLDDDLGRETGLLAAVGDALRCTAVVVLAVVLAVVLSLAQRATTGSNCGV